MQEFFNVSKATWKKKKNELLMHFQHYYEYEVEYNEKDRRKRDYHIIKKIKDYEPPLGKKARQNILYSNKIIEVIKDNPVQTPKNVGRIIQEDDDIIALKHAEGTVYEYTRINMKDMFGNKVGSSGTKGIIECKIWCRADIKNKCYYEMSKEQIDFLYDTFNSLKKENHKKELDIYAEYDSGRITREEMQEAISDNGLSCFVAAKNIFKATYDYYPVKAAVYLLSAF